MVLSEGRQQRHRRDPCGFGRVSPLWGEKKSFSSSQANHGTSNNRLWLLPSGPDQVRQCPIAWSLKINTEGTSGEGGIRTPGILRYTRVPGVHLRPLGHLSHSPALGKLPPQGLCPRGFEPPTFSSAN